MAGLVEKTYGDALFELILEETPGKLSDAKAELTAVNSIISDIPELIKLSKTPTVEKEEKLGLIESAFKGKLSDYIYNFLMVITEAGRLEYFGKITEYFGQRCNEHLGIAEITVVTCEPLTAKAKAELTAKMGKLLGKTIEMKEELDPSIIGGIVVKNGNTTLDGSVRARLNALRTDIGSVVC
ncbi:MAG: ATP synthase F1 subunit delta [Ruminiclostridium sp.]|nr:ATP synthase F1 subunit delta [Ruminiclostridium sp.]